MTRFVIAVVFAAAAVESQPPGQSHNDFFPSWSPDGKHIAFTSDRDNDPEIYTVALDGTGLRRLTRTPGRDAHPSWSPDGTKIAFQSPRNGGHTRLFLMNSDGAAQRQITANEGFCGVPVWSPDGATLAFQCADTRTRLNTPEFPWRVYTMQVPEGRPIVRTHGPGNDQVPNWSPDGKRLVFYSDRSGSDQLYTLELESGRVTQVTRPPGSSRGGSFSPDGKRLVFLWAEGGQPGDIYEMELGSGAGRRLTKIGIEHGLPLFSPDGQRILFQHRGGGSGIMVMGANGAEPRAVNTSGALTK